MTISFEEITGPHRSRDAQRKAILRSIRALKRVRRGTREALADILHLCRARRRARLLEQGEPAAHIFLLAEGRVRVERLTTGGRAILLAQLGRGDVVGDLRLDPSSNATESAIVAEEVTALTGRVSDVRELAARDSGVYDVLCSGLAERCRMAESRLEGLLVRRVDARLAAFLLHAMDRWGVEHGNGETLISTALRHHEMAAMIGTGREWVTMTITRMKRRRILSGVGRLLLVRDHDVLQRLAAGLMEL